MTKPSLMVLVCGMPWSGNRLLRGLVEHHGARAEVLHYGTGIADLVSDGVLAGLRFAAVMPIRDEHAHREAAAPHITEWPDYEAARAAHYYGTCRALALYRVPLLSVRYEHVVENPEGIGSFLIGWLGLGPWRGWQCDVIDGNRKYDPGQDVREDTPEESAAKAAVFGEADKSKEIIAPISASLRGNSMAALSRMTNHD